MTLLAIDPGKAGGFCVRHTDGSVVVHPMPETESDMAALVQEIVEAARIEGDRLEAVLERVGGFIGRGQPGSAMFTFGRGVGVLVGLLLAHRVPFREIPPQAWQKAVGAGSSKGHANKSVWKRHLLDLARKRQPGLAGLTLKTCDAVLLAEAVASHSPS